MIAPCYSQGVVFIFESRIPQWVVFENRIPKWVIFDSRIPQWVTFESRIRGKPRIKPMLVTFLSCVRAKR